VSGRSASLLYVGMLDGTYSLRHQFFNTQADVSLGHDACCASLLCARGATPYPGAVRAHTAYNEVTLIAILVGVVVA
jgi:hypothetical protein